MPLRRQPLAVLVLLGSIWLGPTGVADLFGQSLEGPILLPTNPPYENQPLASELELVEPSDADDELSMDTPEDKPSEDEPSETGESEPAAEIEPPPPPPLNPAMAALRDRARHTLALFHRASLSTSENTATEVMHLCLAFGCDAQLYGGKSSREKINGITCLCWNYPCAGYAPLGIAAGHIAGRIGYGLQEHRGQLLAILALSRVPADYPVRVGDNERTVADLVEYEKLSCRSGTDLSRKLIGLAYYLPTDATWQNSLGEQWSIARMIEEEIAKPVVNDGIRGTDRLMGLSYAVDRHLRQEAPLRGDFLRAANYIEKLHEYALALQNTDGSWGPQMLADRGTSKDATVQLQSTGHVLRWLVFSLPEDQLDDPRIVRSIEYLNRLLGSSRYRHGVKSLSTREIETVMHALHALMLYDQRFFTPRTPVEPAAGSLSVRPFQAR